MRDAIWISAGEASGDMHGALIAKALRERDPNVRLMGMGGPAMEAAGVELTHSMDLLSGVGFTEVLSTIPRFLKLLSEIKARFKAERPRAIVVIDCPEFNFRVGKIAHSLGIPAYYYVCPQVWAWRTGRAKLFGRHFRKALCVLPFEQAFYQDRGARAEYVGNPLLDQIPLTETDRIEPRPNLIGILPGSRSKEIGALLPVFAQVAADLAKERPDLKFRLFPAPGVAKERLTALWAEALGSEAPPMELADPEDRYRAMKECRFLMAASGTVVLEAALVGVPAMVCYRLSKLTFFLAKQVSKVQWASLPNLILNREVLPERFQEQATAGPLAELTKTWLEDKPLAKVRADLAELRRVMGEPGAPGHAAEIILDDLKTLGGES